MNFMFINLICFSDCGYIRVTEPKDFQGVSRFATFSFTRCVFVNDKWKSRL